MTRLRKLNHVLKDGMLVLGVLLIVVAAIPLMAIGAIAIRVLFFVAIAAGAVALLVSPAFRRWLEADSDPTQSYSGVRLPAEVMLHPTHTWARIAGRNEIVVGVDDLMQKALGPPTAVELPRAGTEVRAGDELFRIARDDRSVRVTSPVSGTVVASNEHLSEEPKLISQAPYGIGWAVKVAPSAASHVRSLLQGGKARDWFRQEVDRLLVEASGQANMGAVMQDGGTVVDDFHAQLDEPTWRRIKAGFFADHG